MSVPLPAAPISPWRIFRHPDEKGSSASPQIPETAPKAFFHLVKRDGVHTSKAYPGLLRRIHDAETGSKLTFPTKLLDAPTICALLRWHAELFFKKQRLRIKRFFGRSENAVKTQIRIAVSVYVLIMRKRLKTGSPNRSRHPAHGASGPERKSSSKRRHANAPPIFGNAPRWPASDAESVPRHGSTTISCSMGTSKNIAESASGSPSLSHDLVWNFQNNISILPA